ncbi:MAG TPA: cation acetate symporter [Streptosporangiaceae bacterium]|nr:cation acetate symporter [Streptosporangiaceae bacterium]
MTEFVSIAAITVVMFLTIGVGARGVRIARTPADFMVAAREVSPPVNAAAISGEYLSAASFLGIAGLVFVQGLGSLWYSVGYAAGYLVLLLLVAAPLRRFGAYTIPDFAGGRLQSQRLRQWSTVLVLIIGWFYLLPQMDGAGLTLQVVLGVPYWIGVVVLGVVVSGNIAMGGMKGITFVQAFQYWLKICAIGIPAVVLLMYAGRGSTSNLTVNGAPIFQHPTTVTMTQAVRLVVKRPTRVIATGVVDGHADVRKHVLLRPGTHTVSRGSTLRFRAGARVPVRLLLLQPHSPAWNSPFVSVGPDGAHPLAATYGLIIATFFGAIGLPHILVRFYTNRDGASARRTTLIVLLLLSVFYIFPAILSVLGRLRAPQLYLTGSTDGIVLALPSLILPGPAGTTLAALVAAGAFAAFLSTSSGLLVSVAGAFSHDLMRGGVRSFRWCALGAGAVAVLAALLVENFSATLLVGWAFAIAASSFCPLLVLGIWWRGLTWRGAMAGVLLGGGGCCAAITATMLGLAHSGWSAVLLSYPAMWTVPLAFAVMITVSLASRHERPSDVDQIMLRMHLPDALLQRTR